MFVCVEGMRVSEGLGVCVEGLRVSEGLGHTYHLSGIYRLLGGFSLFHYLNGERLCAIDLIYAISFQESTDLRCYTNATVRHHY